MPQRPSTPSRHQSPLYLSDSYAIAAGHPTNSALLPPARNPGFSRSAPGNVNLPIGTTPPRLPSTPANLSHPSAHRTARILRSFPLRPPNAHSAPAASPHQAILSHPSAHRTLAFCAPSPISAFSFQLFAFSTAILAHRRAQPHPNILRFFVRTALAAPCPAKCVCL